jgi:uncharacterized lipoprotein
MVLCLAMLVYSAQAKARTTLVVSYPMEEVWPTTVRFLRVDRGFPIREKDDAAGYVLFEYREGNRLYKGSFEFIQTTDSQGRSATRIAVSIPDLPRHFEQILLDKLSIKIREDRGYPASPPSKTPPPARDAG